MANFAQSPLDAAQGAVVGALVGDAAGAVLEFQRTWPITEEGATAAAHMPGGGVFNVLPGQITDDGELTLTLARVLAAHSTAPAGLSGPGPGQPTKFPANAAALQYAAWHNSDPFDMGNTCRIAFSSLGGFVDAPDAELAAKVMMRAAAQHSLASEANGALMRASGLAVWSSRLPVKDAVRSARLDASLSHPSVACQDCNVLYCLAIRHLVLYPGDAAGAVQAVEEFVHNPANTISPKVLQWLAESKAEPPTDCRRNMGHLRWAFILSFHLLRQRTGFEDGLLQVLMAGGDTDTNAAICCGMLGALHGVHGIPSAMRAAVLQCDTSRRRPAAYHTKDTLELVGQLLGNECKMV